MRREPRRALRVVLLATLAAVAGTGTTAPPGLAAGTTSWTATRVHRVAAPGPYAIVVRLAPSKVAETAKATVGGKSQSVQVGATGTSLAFWATIGHARRFTVRVTSTGARASFTVGATLQPNAAAPPPTVVPSGSTSPTGPPAPPYKTLVWSDEFTGAAASAPNPANWTADSGGGCGPGTLSTNTASVDNAHLDGAGHLNITALGPTATPAYSTAQLDTGGLFSFTYGRIQARLAVPAGTGLCSAFWLVADNGEQLGWPNGGEIDVMEAIGNIPTQANGFLHGPITNVFNDQQWNGTVQSGTPLAGRFHTYGLIWQPNKLTWTLDGVAFASVTPSTLPPTARWVFNGHPFHIVLDLAVGGWPGTPTPSTVFPATMAVDYVRVYQ